MNLQSCHRKVANMRMKLTESYYDTACKYEDYIIIFFLLKKTLQKKKNHAYKICFDA